MKLTKKTTTKNRSQRRAGGLAQNGVEFRFFQSSCPGIAGKEKI